MMTQLPPGMPRKCKHVKTVCFEAPVDLSCYFLYVLQVAVNFFCKFVGILEGFFKHGMMK